MGGMPYILEKGAVYSVYEDYLSNEDRRWALLDNVRNPHVPMWDVLALDSPTLFASTGLTSDQLKKHTREHWLGSPIPNWVANHGPKNSCTWSNNAAGDTGWWNRWSGPAEGILRETFLRAIEVSFGLAHEAPACKAGAPVNNLVPPLDPSKKSNPTKSTLPTNTKTRFWPIDFLWVCGSETLQGWVTWRSHPGPDNHGQVTVIFATPPPDGTKAPPGMPWHNMYDEPELDPLSAGYNAAVASGYKSGPGVVGDVTPKRGMWVIAAKSSVEAVDTTASVALPPAVGQVDWDEDGHIDLVVVFGRDIVKKPESRYVSTSQVVVVRPSETDGGVLGDPTKYVHP